MIDLCLCKSQTSHGSDVKLTCSHLDDLYIPVWVTDGSRRAAVITASISRNSEVQVLQFPGHQISWTSDWLSMQFLGRVALVRGVAGYSHQIFPWTICRSVRTSVCPCVCLSVCPVQCGKTADRIRMPFGIVDRMGPGMRQIVGFGDRSTGMGTFGGAFGECHCNQWGLGVGVRQCLNRRSCGLGWCVR